MNPPPARSAHAPRSSWTGLLLVSSAGVLWGTVGLGVQVTHDTSGLSPWVIGSYRAAVALVVLVVVALLARRLKTCWMLGLQQWRRALAVGALTAAFQFLFFIAVVWAGVSVSTVVCLGFAPVLLMAVSSVQQRRLPPAGQVATVSVAIIGLLLVTFAGGGADSPPHPVMGTLAALGSGAAYALSARIAGPLTRRIDTFSITILTMTIAAAILIPGGLLVGLLRRETLMTADVPAWGLIAYLGVVTMALAYALLYAGLRTTPSGAAVVATLLEPVAAVLLAVLFLGERLTVTGLVGVLLILIAVATLRGRRPERSSLSRREKAERQPAESGPCREVPAPPH